MTDYQRIEYRISKDGKITETVMGAIGDGCTAVTQAIEQALGEVEQRELLPEYHTDLEPCNTDTIQTTLI
jgi:microcompartment protein CcmL/EutN